MSDSATIALGTTSESELEAWAPRPGEVVSGRYRVIDTIGQGGMGAVVSAEHVQLGEPVAIKFLHPKLARDRSSVERFLREAKATTRIKSEHVVRVLDVGQSESGLPFIVMELLEGADLGRILNAGPLSVSNAVDFVLQASEALAEAHAAGIVHRDLKPSNLWLAQRSDGSPLVKVLDFGISKLSTQAAGDPKLTETQSTFGSPTYMSPEQIRSAKKVDHRTDVWALGVVLHELLTGKLPFDADTVSGVLASIAADPPTPLRACIPSAPPALEAAILACLQKDITRRCQSLAELASLIAPFASPIGLISADRIGRIGITRTNSLVPPPSPSSSSSSVSGDFSSVGGVTERTFATAANVGQSRRSPIFGVMVGVGIALVVVGGAAGVVHLAQGPKTPAATGTAPPSSSAPSAPPAELAHPANPTASSAAVVPVQPSATTPPPNLHGKPRGVGAAPASAQAPLVAPPPPSVVVGPTVPHAPVPSSTNLASERQ